jgi:uncharacterized protein (TIGR02246 family)
MTNLNDDVALRGLVDTFVQGWNAASGAALAEAFAVDADFINVMGLRARGRDVIARGHDEILSTVFRGTHLTAAVESVRFLRPDVGTVGATLTMSQADGQPHPLLPKGGSKASFVATKEHGTWLIAAFCNLIPFARPIAGPVEGALARTQEGHDRST